MALVVVVLVVGHAHGRQVARCSDVATRGDGSAAWSNSLGTCNRNCAPVLLEEDAATVTELLLVQLISEGLEIVVGLFVGEEEQRAGARIRR